MQHSEVEDFALSLGRFVNVEEFSDVKIFVGKERKVFFASSHILASRSQIFQKMFFRSGMKEQQKKEWILKDVQPQNFQDFLQFLYTGKVDITFRNVFDLMELSDKYLFSKLNSSCQQFLKEELKKNAIVMLDEALNRNLKELEQKCLEFIDKETLKYLESPSSFEISEKCMECLLIRDTLNAKEIDLFKFLIKWGKKKSSMNLKEKVKPFLQYIRFPLMNFKELIREVRPLGVISDEQYIEALEFNGDKEFFQRINPSKIVIPRKGSQVSLKSALEEVLPPLPTDPAEERDIIKNLEKENPMKTEDTWYVIATKWFKAWKEYVNYDNANGCSQRTRPGPIENKDIIEHEVDNPGLEKVRRNLMENYDWCVVPEKVWKILVHWYGGGPSLPRPVIPFNSDIYQVEVLPLTLKIVNSSSPSNYVTAIFSKIDTIGHLKETMCNRLGLNPENVRVWDYHNFTKFKLLEDMRAKLQNCQILDSQPILLEEK